MKMIRRDFLKLVGASMVTPSVLAAMPDKQLTIKNARKSLHILSRPTLYDKLKAEDDDWVNEQIDRIRVHIDRMVQGGIKDISIIMSKPLFGMLNKKMSLIALAMGKPDKRFLFGIPVYKSEFLPIHFTDRDEIVHAYVLERAPKSIWGAVALEDIPKDEYGWFQKLPKNTGTKFCQICKPD